MMNQSANERSIDLVSNFVPKREVSIVDVLWNSDGFKSWNNFSIEKSKSWESEWDDLIPQTDSQPISEQD